MGRTADKIKERLPQPLRVVLRGLRAEFTDWALEDVVVHDYQMVPDPSTVPRLTLVVPSIERSLAFGGVTTGLELFFELCRKCGVQGRVVSEGEADVALIIGRAKKFGVEPEIVANIRLSAFQIQVRPTDIFLTFNWWTTLNVRSLLDEQVRTFGGAARPFIYLIQEYEPGFYEFSSTHMMSRLALDTGRPYWGIFNSSLLHDFYTSQGHRCERAFVFEPTISESLRPYLNLPDCEKEKILLVYGRPSIPRNCFPAIRKALAEWVRLHPEFSDWSVVSAGLAHRPVTLGGGRVLRSLGKLSLEDYAQLLRRCAVGLSLMSSPHPSYPPLEMAHFGLLTVTNRYANKDLGSAHDNFISVPDIDPNTLAAALARACAAVETDRARGWKGQSNMPHYTSDRPWAFLDETAAALKDLWKSLG